MKHTVLHQKQLQLGATMTDFQGWQVPQAYTDTQDEYHAVREAAGLFDVGFLGRIEISGPNAGSFLQRIFTRNTEAMPERTAHYGFVCNEGGYVLDDALLFRLSDEDGDGRFLLTTNAVNTEKIVQWLNKHSVPGVRIAEQTTSIAQLALQGPHAPRVLERLLGTHGKKFKPRAVRELTILDSPVLTSRTGYTGEQGYEFFIPSDKAELLWDGIVNAGSELGLLPCGMGSRDILRIEMGYLLYGNDVDENRTPMEACGGAFIDFKKDFIGREPLLKIRAEGPSQMLAGFVLVDKNIPRSGSSIFSENREIGLVTSGALSPLLRKSVGLGYVVGRYSQPGQEIEIEFRDREIAARIEELPFYRKK